MTFASEEDRDLVLDAEDHVLNDKKIDCKKAMSKEEAIEKTQLQIDEQRKIYVRNVPPNKKKSALKKLFQEYGKVEDVNLIYKNSESKGFAFIVFATS